MKCPRCGGTGVDAEISGADADYALDVCARCDASGAFDDVERVEVCDRDESAASAKGGSAMHRLLLSSSADASAGSVPRSGTEHSLVSK